MALGTALVGALLLQAAGAAAPQVGYQELISQDNQAAIEQIESDTTLDRNDPAKLINLAIAYAREGQMGEARALLGLAIRADEPVELKTATGEWVDSRALARKVLAMIDAGEFGTRGRVAAR